MEKVKKVTIVEVEVNSLPKAIIEVLTPMDETSPRLLSLTASGIAARLEMGDKKGTNRVSHRLQYLSKKGKVVKIGGRSGTLTQWALPTEVARWEKAFIVSLPSVKVLKGQIAKEVAKVGDDKVALNRLLNKIKS